MTRNVPDTLRLEVAFQLASASDQVWALGTTEAEQIANGMLEEAGRLAGVVFPRAWRPSGRSAEAHQFGMNRS
jgi:hypothetical protein